MPYKILLIPILLICTGCAQYRGVISTYTSEAARSALIVSEYTLCGATLRSLEEKYKFLTDPNNAESTAIRTLCGGADEEVNEKETL